MKQEYIKKLRENKLYKDALQMVDGEERRRIIGVTETLVSQFAEALEVMYESLKKDPETAKFINDGNVDDSLLNKRTGSV
jgi:hypothetical protein